MEPVILIWANGFPIKRSFALMKEKSNFFVGMVSILKHLPHPMTETFNGIGLGQMGEVIQAIQPHLKAPIFMCFHAEMGAGKTTFICALLKSLGISDPDGSPTYGLVHEYLGDEKQRIYHIDAYRISSDLMALESGLQEIFEENAIFLIEWPEKIPSLIPEQAVSVSIEVLENEKRVFRFL